MAKLYWRVKKDGKWTFRAAKITYMEEDEKWIDFRIMIHDEEEDE